MQVPANISSENLDGIQNLADVLLEVIEQIYYYMACFN